MLYISDFLDYAEGYAIPCHHIALLFQAINGAKAA